MSATASHPHCCGFGSGNQFSHHALKIGIVLGLHSSTQQVSESVAPGCSETDILAFGNSLF